MLLLSDLFISNIADILSFTLGPLLKIRIAVMSCSSSTAILTVGFHCSCARTKMDIRYDRSNDPAITPRLNGVPATLSGPEREVHRRRSKFCCSYAIKCITSLYEDIK